MNPHSRIVLKEVKQAFKIIWWIFSIAGLIIVFVSVFLKHDLVLSISPTCVSMKYFNKECILCGMTRAFLEIGDLRLALAYHLNRGSIILFLLFCVNSIVFITFGFINSIRYTKKL